MIAGTPRSTDRAASLTVQFDDVQLHHSNKIKILGVTIDQHLNFESQTGEVAQRCNRTIASIRKLNFPKDISQKVIQALVFPFVTYCLPAWAPSTQKQRKRIQKVLNFAVRTATGLRKYDHVSQSRRDLGWMSFEEMIAMRDAQRIHFIMWNDESSQQIKSLIETRAQVSERQTRSTVDESVLQIPRCRLQTTKMMFPHRAVMTWNGLPRNLRRGSMAALKKKATAWLGGNVK